MTAKIKWCAALLALATLCVILCLPAAAEGGVRVYDPSGMLTAEETSALAQRMETLAKDRELMERMAQAAWETCRDRFEVSIINGQMRNAIGY
jgi:glycosyltransferase involved in cell wall biosynthesis